MSERAATLTRALVSGLAARDRDVVGACLARGAQLHAELPGGRVDRAGRGDVAAEVAGWVPVGVTARVAHLDVVPTTAGAAFTTRLEVSLGRSTFEIEQRGTVVDEPDGIAAVELVCSPWRARGNGSA